MSYSPNLCLQCRRQSTRILGKDYPQDSWTNVPKSILALTDRKLHLQKNHPISILRDEIESLFPTGQYSRFNTFEPVVTVAQNFDSLGFPADHIGRSKSDTYYVNQSTVLRTHTSAHQADTFRSCSTPGFLISADVYRRDEIDRTHYPVFHQTEGARSWKTHAHLAEEIDAEIAAMRNLNIVVQDDNPPHHADRNPVQAMHKPEHSEAVVRHLKRTIESIAARIFQTAVLAAKNSSCESATTTTMMDNDWDRPLRVRWNEDYFPFTSPSWELEVFWNNQWLELCGCGVIQSQLLHGIDSKGHHQQEQAESIGWAFGLGLDRIAMILFGVPDIRLFWSLDDRFLRQFESGKVVTFQSYSKYPKNTKDLSFWLPRGEEEEDSAGTSAVSGVRFQENDFMEIARSVAGDLIEDVKLVDSFTHPKSGRESRCYRINYRSMDRSLSNEEVNSMQEEISRESQARLGVELR